MIKHFLWNTFLNIWANTQIKRLPVIKHTFTDALLKNASLLSNRVSLLQHLPKQGVVAEIGVDAGIFSDNIIQHCSPRQLFLIDHWIDNTDFQEIGNKYQHVPQVNLIRSRSLDAATLLKDSSLDWIYLDTDHGYEMTLAELYAFAAKVKPNGIICGHDFIIGNWNKLVRYGVIEAVTEFCITEKWELIYLTMDYTEFPSFAIRRIS